MKLLPTGKSISEQSVYLLNDTELIGILKRKGIDCSRKTYINEFEGIYYVSNESSNVIEIGKND